MFYVICSIASLTPENHSILSSIMSINKNKPVSFMKNMVIILGSHFKLSDCKQLKSNIACIIEKYGQELRLFLEDILMYNKIWNPYVATDMNNLLSMCLGDVKQTLKSDQESGNNSNVSIGRIPLTLITRISSLTFPKCNTLSEKRKTC